VISGKELKRFNNSKIFSSISGCDRKMIGKRYMKIKNKKRITS